MGMRMGKDEKTKHKSIKTTITLEEDLWKRFGILVIQKFGGRKKNDLIVQLIREYVEKNEK